MSLIGRALKEARTVTPVSVPSWLLRSDVTGGSGASSGVAVTETTAMTCSAVYAAVSFISETIATLPCDIMQRYGDGSRYPRPDPGWKANPIPGQMGWTEFVAQVMTSLLLDGNAFIGIERDETGIVPAVVWPLNPQSVSVVRDPATMGMRYLVSTTAGMEPFTSDQILHIRAMTLPGGVRGMSPIAYAADSIGRTLAAGNLAASYFKNGALPGTVITADKQINDETAKAIQVRFDNAHAGSLNAFKTVVLGNGATVHAIPTLSPDQIQMLETLKYGITDIARIFRIPPHIIGEVDRSTSWGTGIAEQNQMVANFTLSPWVVRLQRSLQRIVTDTYSDPAYYLAFNLRGLMRADPKATAEYMKAKIECQAATPNEWRGLDDENPLPDGGTVLESVQFTPKTPAVPPPQGVSL